MKIIATLWILSLTVLFVSESCADTFGTGGNTFNIDFVTIGNPGNAYRALGFDSLGEEVRFNPAMQHRYRQDRN